MLLWSYCGYLSNIVLCEYEDEIEQANYIRLKIQTMENRLIINKEKCVNMIAGDSEFAALIIDFI